MGVIGMTVCSGIGVPELSAPWIDWRWQSEIEPAACRVLAKRFPNATNLGDMSKFKEWPDATVDVLAGGTPCQSFSVAGLRKGLDDPRGNLMLTYLAIVERYRPRWLVWENVPGVLSSTTDDIPDPRPPEVDLDGDDGPEDGQEVVVEDEHDGNETHALGCFLAGLSELGYGFAYRVRDAQFTRTSRHPRAVPQRRRRVFVVGYLGDWRRAAAVLFDAESLRGHPPPRRQAGQGVAGTLAARIGGGGGLGTDFDLSGGLVPDVAGTMKACAQSGGFSNSADHAAAGYMLPVANSGDVGYCLTASAQQSLDAETETETLIAQPVAPAVTGNPYGDHESREGLLVAHSLRGEGFDASEDGTGRGTLLVPITIMQRGREGGPSIEWRQDGTANAILTPNGGRAGMGVGAICAPVGFSFKDYGNDAADNLSPTLRSLGAQGANGGSHMAVATQWAVRRLMPVECERLQGLEDGFTDVPNGNKPMADGLRYKMIGNAWALNAGESVFEGIRRVDALAQGEAEGWA